MIGQHVDPKRYHPAVDLIPLEELRGLVASVKRVIDNCVAAMPMHQAFIDRYCKAPAV